MVSVNFSKLPGRYTRSRGKGKLRNYHVETEPADRFMDRGKTPFGDFQKELEDIVEGPESLVLVGILQQKMSEHTYIHTFLLSLEG